MYDRYVYVPGTYLVTAVCMYVCCLYRPYVVACFSVGHLRMDRSSFYIIVALYHTYVWRRKNCAAGKNKKKLRAWK